MPQESLILNGQALTLPEIEAVARRRRPVGIGSEGRQRVTAARAVVDNAVSNRSDLAVYGVNTGFGSLAQVRIEPDQLRAVQRNLLRSHAVGVGEPLDDEVVRAMMLILAASLCRGCSGVRIDVVELILAILNKDITPIVPSRGSVGASGDLAPLAHLGLVLIGEGAARLNGQQHRGDDALRTAGLLPLTLEAKEGLAVINGTHMMAAIGALALCDVERLMSAALAACAMAVDGCRATDAFLDDRIHAVRNQPGQRRVAGELRTLLQGSQIISAHKDGDPRVQDPYCLRAAPQVLGAALDAIEYARIVVERELNAVTDNPLVFPSDTAGDAFIVSGGNFHGMPLAIAFDALKIALCHVAGIAERRIFWVLSGTDSENPVPVYLSPQPGLNSGMMIVQYTAAACCNELQTLAHPASVHNISTSAGIEDYNSMGATSAHQTRAAVELATNVVAAELLVMAQALEFQRPLRSGEEVERIHHIIRGRVPKLTEDRPLAKDLQTLGDLIRTGKLP